MPLWTLSPDDDDVKERIDNGELNPEDIKYMNTVKSLPPERDVIVGLATSWVTCRWFRRDDWWKRSGRLLRGSIWTSLAIAATTGSMAMSSRIIESEFKKLSDPEGFKRTVLDIKTRRMYQQQGAKPVYYNWTYGILIGNSKHNDVLPEFAPEAPLRKDQSAGIPSESLNVSDDFKMDSATAMQSSVSFEPDESSTRRSSRRPVNTQQNADQSAQASTRWDEIRKANAGGQQTHWDLIRQKHEREQIERAKAPSTTDGESDFERPSRDKPLSSDDRRSSDDPQDEMTEQERFDALLEAERRRSAEGADTGSGRWGR